MSAKGFQWYPGQHEALQRAFESALVGAAEDVLADVRAADVVPRVESAREGRVAGLLEDSAEVDASGAARGNVRIRFGAPHARATYYRPLDYTKAVNPNARDHWMEPWLPGGARANFGHERFKERLRKARRWFR